MKPPQITPVDDMVVDEIDPEVFGDFSYTNPHMHQIKEET